MSGNDESAYVEYKRGTGPAIDRNGSEHVRSLSGQRLQSSLGKILNVDILVT